MTTPTLDPVYRPGLQGVIAAETRLSHIDGQAGQLVIAGYALEDIAPRATFEEMLFLLWQDRPPDAPERDALAAQLAARRTLPPQVMDVLRAAAARGLPVMDALRMAAGLLSLSLSDDTPQSAAETLVAAFPTIIAAYWRLLQAETPIDPHSDLGHAANFLYMLDGQPPEASRVRALETYLNTVIDHGFNASTFTARVIASTGSDMVAAITGAIGALKGPLHGGAPGPALELVFEIGTPERAEAVIQERLDQGERLMGFGHRVYKVRDPRADVLNAAAERFFVGEHAAFYELVRHVEAVALRLLEAHKPGRGLQTNVEFYTALLLHGIGLPTELFTPAFAIARVGGWTANALEQQANGRIMRPLSAYTGAQSRRW